MGPELFLSIHECQVAKFCVYSLKDHYQLILSVSDELDSYMFQTVGHEGIHLYAEAMELPLYQETTQGDSVTKEMTYEPVDGDEVEDLYRLLNRVKNEVVGGVEGVASGAILSDYQRIRVENV